MSGKNTQNQEYIPVPVILRNNKTKVVMTAKIIVTLLRLKLNLFIIYKEKRCSPHLHRQELLNYDLKLRYYSSFIDSISKPFTFSDTPSSVFTVNLTGLNSKYFFNIVAFGVSS